MRNWMRPMGIVAALGILITAPMVAQARETGAVSVGECPAGPTIPARELRAGVSAAACGLIGRLVTSGSASVYVPPRGEGVQVAADSTAGSVSLTVETSATGIVTAAVETLEEPAGRTVSARALQRACSLKDKKPTHRKWFGTPAWRINEAGHPKSVSAAVFRDVMRQSANAIHIGANDCGIRFKQVVSLKFNGGTTRHSNINGAKNRCAKNRDKHNVVDFGNLTGDTLGLTCTRWSSRLGDDKLIEADLRLDNTRRRWVTSLKKCTGARYDMLSVGVHEFGHFVGLDHVKERGHADLTMSVGTENCDASPRTLGRGDLDALSANY